MAAVKSFIDHSNYNTSNQSMLWANISTAVFSLLRASEYVAVDTNTVESDRTLTWSSVSCSPAGISIQLKWSKTAQDGHRGVVELQATHNELCPVLAFRDHANRSCRQDHRDDSVFTFQSGKFLTRDDLTKMLRHALQTTSVSSRSLRIGSVPHMANSGATKAQIRRAGQWRSSAGDRYMRICRYALFVE